MFKISGRISNSYHQCTISIKPVVHILVLYLNYIYFRFPIITIIIMRITSNYRLYSIPNQMTSVFGRCANNAHAGAVHYTATDDLIHTSTG